MNSSGILHGVALWFDIEYSKGLGSNLFSSNPNSELDNYYHGIFYLKVPAQVQGGDTLKGNLGMKRNS